MQVEISAEKYDKPLLIITMILLSIGTVMVFSSSADISLDKFGSSSFYFSKHLMRVFLGLIIMVIAMFIDFRLLKKIAAPLLILSSILLLLTKLVFIFQGNHNPARWLYIGPFTLQTSDLARFSIIIYLASYIDRRRDGVRDYLKFVINNYEKIEDSREIYDEDPNSSKLSSNLFDLIEFNNDRKNVSLS